MKDPSTGGVINTDREGLRAAKRAKQRILDSRRKEEEMEARIAKLESAIEQLLSEKSNG